MTTYVCLNGNPSLLSGGGFFIGVSHKPRALSHVENKPL